MQRGACGSRGAGGGGEGVRRTWAWGLDAMDCQRMGGRQGGREVGMGREAVGAGRIGGLIRQALCNGWSVEGECCGVHPRRPLRFLFPVA